MSRPPEYDNLIQAGYFHVIHPTPQNVRQYTRVATAYIEDAKRSTHAASQFALAYEAFFQLVQSVLEFHGVRATDRPGHRIVAIQRVCADLKLSPGQVKLITDTHARRNETVYRAPLPPISRADAEAMMRVTDNALPQVILLTGVQP